MATNLYETLGISKSATPEQVRKAYKKKALETHPDRLGPGVSSADKAQSEDFFRKVNNAYEVLRDPQNRRIYDQHGVWPPPEASMPYRGANSSHRSHGQYHSGSRNNFYDPWGGHRSAFMFTDPFALFDSIFDDISPHRGSHHYRHHHERPWFAAELSRLMDDDFGFPHHGFGGFTDFPFGRGMLPASQPPFFGINNGGQWQAESFVSTTVNGVTQSSHRRRDWNVDEHETHTYADGRKVHKVNGVEQAPGHDQLPPPPAHSRNQSDQRLSSSVSIILLIV
ncbi:Chaperone protein dnaJ 1 [Termitomyces sp. J132]|nr:Chaperone protein dnaJ 1 [Termitomyces sp. J132]